jgi:hypothetical protein
MPACAGQLPAGWSAAADASGTTYYVNAAVRSPGRPAIRPKGPGRKAGVRAWAGRGWVVPGGVQSRRMERVRILPPKVDLLPSASVQKLA